MGFHNLNQDISVSGPNALTGWNVSPTFRVKHQYGFVADFSGYYPEYNPGCIVCGQHAKIYSFLFGPQVSITKGRVTPFARFLLGDTHMHPTIGGIPNYVTFTLQQLPHLWAGGGVDVALTHRFALRGQVDWLHNGFQTLDNQRRFEEIHNVARISTGVVIRA